MKQIKENSLKSYVNAILHDFEDEVKNYETIADYFIEYIENSEPLDILIYAGLEEEKAEDERNNYPKYYEMLKDWFRDNYNYKDNE